MKADCLLLVMLAIGVCSGEPHKAMHSLANGFVSGLSGPQATIPASCLDLETVIGLEDSLISAIGEFIRGSDSFDAKVTLFTHRATRAIESCHLDNFLHTIGVWNSSSRMGSLILSSFLHLQDSWEGLEKVIESAMNFDWMKCGFHLGKVVRTITQASNSDVVLPGLKSFLNALILGMTEKEVSSHPCAEKVSHLFRYFGPFLEGLFAAVFYRHTSQLDMVISLMSEYTDEIVVACRLEDFEKEVGEQIRTFHVLYLVANILKNEKQAIELSEQIDNTCYAGSWEECGRVISRFLKLIIDWEL